MKANTYKFFLLLALFLVMPLSLVAQSKKSDEFFGKGIEAFEKNDFSNAIKWFSKADELDRKEMPESSTRLQYSKDWIAHCHYLNGDTDKASEISSYYIIKPVDRRLTVESDREADIAFQCMNEGNYEEALNHAINCISIEEKVLGQDSEFYVNSCLEIGNIYQNLNNHIDAEKYYSRGLKSIEKQENPLNLVKFKLLQGRIESNLCLNLIALSLLDLEKLKEIASIEEKDGNKYPMAITKLIVAEVELKKFDDIEAISDATCNCFNYVLQLYDPKEEESFNIIGDCIQILKIIDKRDIAYNLLKHSIPILETKSVSLKHKGILLSQLSMFAPDLDLAKLHLEEGINLLSASGDDEMLYSSKALMAQLKQEEGLLNEAFHLYKDACDYFESTNNPRFIHTSECLADLMIELGDIDDAIKCYSKLNGILSEDKDSPEYILSFLKFFTACAKAARYGGNIDLLVNRYELGKEFTELSNTIQFENLLRMNPNILDVSYIIVDLYHEILSKASLSYGISIRQIETQLETLLNQTLIPNFTIKNYLTRFAIQSLAHAKYLLADNDAAISLTKTLIDVAKAEGWDYDNYLHDLAYYQYDSGDTKSAYDNFRIGYEFQKENILKCYKWMTLDERTALTAAKRGNLDNMAHYAAITPNDARYAELGYDALLFTKGLLLNSTIELNRILAEEGDPETLQLLSKWRLLNQQLKKTENSGNDSSDGLREEAIALEKTLLEKSKSFGDYTKGMTVTYKDVQCKLNDNDLAIEFCSYFENASSKHYGAIILTKNAGPRYIDIGNDSKWKHIDISNECYTSSQLFDLLFADLKDFLPSKELGNVYFAADGILHSIAIENLPGAENYSFRRLSSTREIALATNAPVKASNLVLFGGISYGLGEVAAYYPASSDSDNRAAADFLVDLPGTKTETEKIHSLLDGKLNVRKHIGDNASKSEFISYSGKGVDIIHVATHGFFDRSITELNNVNPLASSGLYFAGAQNTIWDMDMDGLKDNGILTSEEISTMDLRGLKLAVLSACETGLGHLNPDGVFGLQRGLKQAGANSVLMSLWKVSDAATQLLMTEFYRNLIDGMNQYDALDSAKSVVIKSYPNPSDWAAFVLIDAINNLKI